MKRFSTAVLTLSLLGMLTFSACDKKNKNELSRSAQVIGNWDMTSLAIDLNQDGVMQDNEMIPPIDPSASVKLRFLVDHTGMAFGSFGPFNANEDFRWGFTDFENTMVVEAIGLSTPVSVVHFQGRDMTLAFQEPGLPAVWGSFRKQ